jgi:vacuolar-type H+-ATPase subunit I/STV1
MPVKSATLSQANERDDNYLSQINECLAEIAEIRREMKKTDAETSRLEASTRGKLIYLRANLHVKKAA